MIIYPVPVIIYGSINSHNSVCTADSFGSVNQSWVTLGLLDGPHSLPNPLEVGVFVTKDILFMTHLPFNFMLSINLMLALI